MAVEVELHDLHFSLLKCHQMYQNSIKSIKGIKFNIDLES